MISSFPPYTLSNNFSPAVITSSFVDAGSLKTRVRHLKLSSFLNFCKATPLPIKNNLEVVSDPSKACRTKIALHTVDPNFRLSVLYILQLGLCFGSISLLRGKENLTTTVLGMI